MQCNFFVRILSVCSGRNHWGFYQPTPGCLTYVRSRRPLRSEVVQRLAQQAAWRHAVQVRQTTSAQTSWARLGSPTVDGPVDQHVRIPIQVEPERSTEVDVREVCRSDSP